MRNSDLDESDKFCKYEKFREDFLNKYHDFKISMKFKSLVKFKDAIR